MASAEHGYDQAESVAGMLAGCRFQRREHSIRLVEATTHHRWTMGELTDDQLRRYARQLVVPQIDMEGSFDCVMPMY